MTEGFPRTRSLALARTLPVPELRSLRRPRPENSSFFGNWWFGFEGRIGGESVGGLGMEIKCDDELIFVSVLGSHEREDCD